jgi:signal transduction histidine kinase
MTLKTRIRNLTLIAMIGVGLGSVLILAGYGKIQAAFEKETLTRSINEQIEKLIPSLLLPEQREGVVLLLNKFKSDEQLLDIRILEKADAEPQTKLDEISIAWPIIESGQNLGYLYKSKKATGVFTSKLFLFELLFLIVILMAVWGAVLWTMRRVTSQDIPRELDALLKWTESHLSTAPESGRPELKFEEFRQLSFRIKTLIDYYEKTREQAVIGQLTSGIMHDIKTPLHSLMTAYHLIQELPIHDPKRSERMESLVRVSGTKLKKIFDIVELTLDGYRDLKINPVDLDLKMTLLKSLTETKDLLVQRGIQVELDLIPTQLRHDRVQLSRVFTNLIKNAAESFDEIKNNTESPRVRLSMYENKVTIEDSGPGLKINSEKIFSLFGSTKPRGSGLGLLVSKKIVEAHKGLIRAYPSKDLKGACFEVTFPEEACS